MIVINKKGKFQLLLFYDVDNNYYYFVDSNNYD